MTLADAGGELSRKLANGQVAVAFARRLEYLQEPAGAVSSAVALAS